MVDGSPAGCIVPKSLLDRYERNFRVLVFPTAQGKRRDDYKPKIAFISLVPARMPDEPRRSFIVGQPKWLFGNETPGSYDGAQPFTFLAQIPPGYRFDTLPGSPRQRVWVFTEEAPSHDPHYELFRGNAVYIWGVKDGDTYHTYLLTQR